MRCRLKCLSVLLKIYTQNCWIVNLTAVWMWLRLELAHTKMHFELRGCRYLLCEHPIWLWIDYFNELREANKKNCDNGAHKSCCLTYKRCWLPVELSHFSVFASVYFCSKASNINISAVIFSLFIITLFWGWKIKSIWLFNLLMKSAVIRLAIFIKTEAKIMT